MKKESPPPGRPLLPRLKILRRPGHGRRHTLFACNATHDDNSSFITISPPQKLAKLGAFPQASPPHPLTASPPLTPSPPP
jgi:hypothetical protein